MIIMIHKKTRMRKELCKITKKRIEIVLSSVFEAAIQTPSEL